MRKPARKTTFGSGNPSSAGFGQPEISIPTSMVTEFPIGITSSKTKTKPRGFTITERKPSRQAIENIFFPVKVVSN